MRILARETDSIGASCGRATSSIIIMLELPCQRGTLRSKGADLPEQLNYLLIAGNVQNKSSAFLADFLQAKAMPLLGTTMLNKRDHPLLLYVV